MSRRSLKHRNFTPLSEEEELLYSRIENALSEDEVAEFEDRLDAAMFRKRMIRLTILKVAAIFFTLLGLSGLTYHLTHPSHKKLFGQYYHHFPAENSSGVARGELDLKTEALLMYSGQEYQQSALKFRQALLQHPDDLEIRFLLAISLIETGGLSEPLELLKEVINAEENFYTDDALWYASLIFLKKSDYAACREHLIRIRNNSEYYQPARELYNKISDK